MYIQPILIKKLVHYFFALFLLSAKGAEIELLCLFRIIASYCLDEAHGKPSVVRAHT